DHGLDQKAYWAAEFPEENPRSSRAVVAKWPYDPLDGPDHYRVEAREDGRLPEPDEHAVLVRRSHPRREVLEQSAACVRAAVASKEQLDDDLAQRIDWVLDRAQVPITNDVHMPEHISTSRFVEL